MICQQLDSHLATIDGYENVPTNNEGALLQALARQPVSVAIEAQGRDFQLYISVSEFLATGPV